MASSIAVREGLVKYTPHLETVSGNIATFNTDMAAPLSELKVHFYPQQSGSGTPSPDNVRPISGWDSLEVYETGKNLFGGEKGEYFPLFLAKNTNVIFSCAVQHRIDYYDKNKQMIDYWNSILDDPNTDRKYRSFTILEDTYYSRITGSGSTSTKDAQIQIEIGTDPTVYEPFGNKIPVSFPSSAGTVYGGYVDLIRGKLVAEWVSARVGDLYVQLNSNSATAWSNWHIQPTRTGLPHSKYEQGTYDVIAISDSFDADRRGLTQTTEKAIIWATTSNVADQIRFKYRADCALSANEFKEKYADVRIAYMVQDPIEYDLDPVTLRTLRGVNNVWSNANGECDVTYWTH